MNKRNWTFVATFLFLFPLGLEAKETIKIATLAPTGTTWVNELKNTHQTLLEKSSGQLGFRIYAGGILGDESDVIRKMRVGQVHAAAFTGRGLGEILPEVRVLELPFLAQTDDDVDRLTRDLFSRFEKGFASKGFTFLGFVPVGFVYLFSDQSIASLQDLRKSKVWVWEGDPLALDLFKNAGVSGIPLALPEVLTSLQTRLIDTVYNTSLGMIALQWHTKVRYRTDLAIAHVMGGILVVQKKFNRLSTAHQALLKKEAGLLCQRLSKAGRKENLQALATLKKGGIQTAAVTPSARNDFLSLAPKVAQQETGRLFPKDLLEKAKKILTQKD